MDITYFLKTPLNKQKYREVSAGGCANNWGRLREPMTSEFGSGVKRVSLSVLIDFYPSKGHLQAQMALLFGVSVPCTSRHRLGGERASKGMYHRRAKRQALLLFPPQTRHPCSCSAWGSSAVCRACPSSPRALSKNVDLGVAFFQNVIQAQQYCCIVQQYQEMPVCLRRWRRVSKLPPLAAATSQQFNWSGPRPGTWNFL